METSRDHAREGAASIIRTRCPSCHKLYAVDLQAEARVDGDTQHLFQCTACNAQFALHVPFVADGNDYLSFLVVDPEGEIELPKALRRERASAAAMATAAGTSANAAVTPAQGASGGGLETATDSGPNSAPVRSGFAAMPMPNAMGPVASATVAAPLTSTAFSTGMMEPIDSHAAPERIAPETATEWMACPKCNAKNSIDRESCKACGIVFKTYVVADEQVIAGEIALGAKPELILLWKEIIDHYEVDAKHDAFIEACSKANALPYAANKYGRILAQFPDEEIALKMKNRVQKIASAPFEVAPRPAAPAAATNIATAKTAPVTSKALPRMNSIVILFASIVLLMGLSMQGMQQLTGVGASMLALALGLRFFASRSNL